MSESDRLPDRLFLWSRQAKFIGNSMRAERKNCFPPDHFPSIKGLAAAIKRLPTPSAEVGHITVKIHDRPACGHYLVTFGVRQDSLGLSCYWGVETSERLVDGPSGAEESA